MRGNLAQQDFKLLKTYLEIADQIHVNKKPPQ